MRIAALSDQHGYLPDVPECDLLIVAGDVCPDVFRKQFAANNPEAQKAWFDETARPWLAAANARHRILTWGNHDWCGERCDFSGDGHDAASSETLLILNAQSTYVQVGGERAHVWASPWSRQFGHWAFMRRDEELARIYETIPDDVDVVVSHQPPFGYRDEVPGFAPGQSSHEGSRALLAAIDRVKPRLLICGHIHEGHGRAEHGPTRIYNVSVVDEHYQLVHPVTTIDF